MSMKDRTGSSRHAIKAYILAKYGDEPTAKALTHALSQDIFVKNKGSFMLKPGFRSPAAEPLASLAASSGLATALRDVKREMGGGIPTPSAAAAQPKPEKKKSAAAGAKKPGKEKFVKVLDAKPLKLKLNNMVKVLAKMVDDDWHDGWEEQGEKIWEYLKALQEPLTQVINVCVQNRASVDKREFVEANEILKAVADTYANLHTVPMRGSVEDVVRECDADFTLPGAGGDELSNAEDAFQFVWTKLARAAARGTATDMQVNRIIKDAVDNGASVDPESDEDEDEDEDAAASTDRLRQLYHAGEWRSLKTTKKKRKMRRAIDRRFDGTPSRRTRDYHLHDPFGYGGYGGDDY